MALETWAIKSRSLACFLVASWKSTQFLLVWLMLGFGARSKSNNRRGIVSRPSHFFINSCPSGVAQLASHVAKLTFNRVPRIPMVGNWPFLRMFPMNIALMHPSDSMSLEHLCVCVLLLCFQWFTSRTLRTPQEIALSLPREPLISPRYLRSSPHNDLLWVSEAGRSHLCSCVDIREWSIQVIPIEIQTYPILKCPQPFSFDTFEKDYLLLVPPLQAPQTFRSDAWSCWYVLPTDRYPWIDSDEQLVGSSIRTCVRASVFERVCSSAERELGFRNTYIRALVCEC